MELNLTYPAILSLFGRYMNSGTETRAFLAWFLESYYRLEGLEVYDSVCDGANDKGIDGIYVNNPAKQIDFFQVTVLKAANKTLGDAKLKQFCGAVAQFTEKAKAEPILAVAGPDLKALAERVELVKRIEEGFAIRGLFITNATADRSATTFLSTQP